MLYPLNLYSDIYQLFLSKTGKAFTNKNIQRPGKILCDIWKKN